MVRSVTRARRSGSIPASRKSCCRHSHGVGTSETVANLSCSQIGEPERRRIASADQKERIAGGDLAKADERRLRVVVARLHDAHRPAPGEVDGAVEEVRGGCGRCGRWPQLDLDTFAGIETERLRGIEWRVEDGAKILRELDRHDAQWDLAISPLGVGRQ